MKGNPALPSILRASKRPQEKKKRYADTRAGMGIRLFPKDADSLDAVRNKPTSSRIIGSVRLRHMRHKIMEPSYVATTAEKGSHSRSNLKE